VTLTRTQRTAIGCVAAGALLIALIGFTGSYNAVQELAARKGFGFFSYVLPAGVDIGIAVLLALDLVLTWLRIPFPLLRQTAWLLTVSTIVFNAASAWPDPLAVAMHAIIPVLFLVVVEAARHAVGELAAISVGKRMESVRLVRWLLSPVPTFRLWRRMKLWELRSYNQVVQLEQNRLVYRTQLRAQYGRGWRRRAPVELLLPLKLARYGVPLLVPVCMPDREHPDETDSPEPGVSALEAARLRRIEQHREARRQAATSWWQTRKQAAELTVTEHARQLGISPGTLRKALAEFPETTTGATP